MKSEPICDYCKHQGNYSKCTMCNSKNDKFQPNNALNILAPSLIFALIVVGLGFLIANIL